MYGCWVCIDVLLGFVEYCSFRMATLSLVTLYIMANRISFLLFCKLFHSSCSSISPTDDRFLYFPMTYLAALLCSFSIESICPCWYGSHTVAECSSCCLTKVFKACCLMFLEEICRLRWRNPNVQFASLHMLEIWVPQLRSDVKVTAKYFVDVSCCRMGPWSV